MLKRDYWLVIIIDRSHDPFIFCKSNWAVYSYFTYGKIGLLNSVRGVTKCL